MAVFTVYISTSVRIGFCGGGMEGDFEFFVFLDLFFSSSSSCHVGVSLLSKSLMLHNMLLRAYETICGRGEKKPHVGMDQR